MPIEPQEPRADEDFEYRTLREPFTATGEAFSVSLSMPIPEYPTLQEATTVTSPEPTNSQAASQRSASARRTADPVSIGAGLVFLLLGGAYLLASGGHVTVNAGWTLSFLLLGLGLSGVVGSFLRARRDRRGRTNRDEW